MFLVSDTRTTRNTKIRSFLQNDPVVSIILAAADFEWTVRRAIVALGGSPTKYIRENILKNCHGLDAYKDAWKQEVDPRLKIPLTKVVADWQFFRMEAFILRHKLVHGVTGSVTVAFAQPRLDAILAASDAVTIFAADNGEPLYGRRIRRTKKR